MFDLIGRLVVMSVGGAFIFLPAYTALMVAGAPVYAAFPVGLISGFAGAAEYALIQNAQKGT